VKGLTQGKGEKEGEFLKNLGKLWKKQEKRERVRTKFFTS
jgi:hypothetical protein